MLFPVQRPGEEITAEWKQFFFILPFSFFGQKFQYFLNQKKKEKKRKKENGAARLATISATAGQETNFYLRVAL